MKRIDAALARVHDIHDRLYNSDAAYQAASCAAQQEAACAAFAAATNDLLKIYIAMMMHEQEMHDGLTPMPGKILILRRRQPRDARGRFIKSIPE